MFHGAYPGMDPDELTIDSYHEHVSRVKRVRQYITNVPGLSEALTAETHGRECILLAKFGIAENGET